MSANLQSVISNLSGCPERWVTGSRPGARLTKLQMGYRCQIAGVRVTEKNDLCFLTRKKRPAVRCIDVSNDTLITQ